MKTKKNFLYFNLLQNCFYLISSLNFIEILYDTICKHNIQIIIIMIIKQNVYLRKFISELEM